MASTDPNPAPSPDPASMQQLVLAQLREQAAAAARAGRPAEAERYYQRALDLDEGNADLWARLGSVVSGEARAACARRALALVPGHPLAQALLSGAALLPGEPDSGGADGAAAPAARPPATSPAAAPSPNAACAGAAFRLPAPRLRPDAAGRARTPFWAQLQLPRLDLAALRRRRAPRPSTAPTAARRPAFRLTRPARIRLLAAAVLALVVAANLLLAWRYERQYAGRIVPGVRIEGVDVGGLTPAAAEFRLQEEVAATLRRTVRLEYGGRSWTLTASEIGLYYRTGDAVQEAAAWGHRAGGWASWRERVRAGLGGIQVRLPAEAEDSRLRAVLDRIAADVDRPAVPPAVAWQEGNWLISPGQDGRHVVREETQERLVTALTTLVYDDAPAAAPLLVALPVVTDSAALAAADYDRLRGELAQVAQPLTVRCGAAAWELTTSDIAAWLSVGLAPPAVEVNALALEGFLADVAPLVNVAVQLPRMEIVDGRVSVFQVGSDGLVLDVEASLAHLRSALDLRLRGQPVQAVDLVTQVVPAGEDELMAQMGVLELIGEGHSSFRDSSWARVTNIVVGGRELNGRLVAPDEVFSLNAALDPVSWEKGYVMSEVIVEGGVGYGMGGGLCQLATTLYRAALRTGLEVVERHEHAWRLDWYEQDSPPGFDATIMLGGPDLKFRNNTGHHILIQTETNAAEAWQVVRIYGTPPGWEVTIGEPARDGSGLYFRRTVTKDGQVLIDETVYSHY